MSEEKQERPTVVAEIPRPRDAEEFHAALKALASIDDPRTQLVGLAMLLVCMPMPVHTTDLALCAQMLASHARHFSACVFDRALAEAALGGEAGAVPTDEKMN